MGCRSQNPVTDCPFRDGAYDFAQEQPEVAEYPEATSIGWVRQVHPRGIRMDTTNHVPAAYFRNRWLPKVRDGRELFVVAEVFSGDVAELETYLDAGFDAVLNYPLHGVLIDTFAKGAPVAKLREALDASDDRLHGHVVNFVDNHDVPRFATELTERLPAEEALPRYHVALTALFTIPGVPQLYYGDELALLGGRNPDNRRDMPAWAFTPEGRASPHPEVSLGIPEQTHAWVSRLTRLRHEHSALVDGSLGFIVHASEPGSRSVSPVSNTTGSSGVFSRARFARVMPSIPGRFRSTSSRSGANARSWTWASSAVLTASTS